jgi:amino-acid N-acetyltransferase
MPSLRPANQADGDAICDLLAAVHLPTEGVKENIDSFVVYEIASGIVAAGGLEFHGKLALLRSVVVETGQSGNGLGALICDRLETAARDKGVQTIYLLTASAASFFRTRGYEELDRAQAPKVIRETEQFARLCPASAILMHRASAVPPTCGTSHAQ